MKIKLLLCVVLACCTFGLAKEKANVPGHHWLPVER